MSYWAIVPAGGVGARMGEVLPKQYLLLHGKSIIQHTLERLFSHAQISGVVVAISAQDREWQSVSRCIDTQGKSLLVASGGAERFHSVLNALEELSNHADRRDWVLVHDAIRPCLRHTAINRLIAALADHPVGGLLGIRIPDTVKRVDGAANVVETLDREQLWLAQTPQMFRLGALRDALHLAIERQVNSTDEAMAMALTGATPRMVEGDTDNIKITRPPDLALAQFYLSQQEQTA